MNQLIGISFRNDSYPQVEARSIMDINTLNITELKSKQFENMHVIFSCGYLIALKIGRYGPDSRQLFVYKADPDNFTSVPSDPITILRASKVSDCDLHWLKFIHE